MIFFRLGKFSMIFHAIVAIFALLLITSSAYPITIDGNFDDWAGIPVVGTDAGGDISGSDPIDWTAFYAKAENNNLYISYQTASNIDFASNSWRYNIFIDSDNNLLTGYRGNDSGFKIGADYLFQGAGLYKYMGDGTDWGWVNVAFYPYAINNNRLETVIPESALFLPEGYTVRMLLHGDNPQTKDYAKDTKEGFIFQDTLAGYWSFDDMALDSSNHSNAAVITGAVYAEGAKNKALFFDGSDDYAQIPNTECLQLDKGLTISFWIKPKNAGIVRINPIDKSYGGEFSLTIEPNGQLSYYHGTQQITGYYFSWAALGPKSLINDKWQHIAITRNHTARILKSYLDGRLIKETTYPSDSSKIPSKTTYPVKIAKGYTNNPLGGAIDELKLYSRAIPEQDVWKDYSTSVLRLNLNENSGQSASDATLYHNNAQILGSALWQRGFDGYSILFDGSDDYLKIPSSKSLNPQRLTLRAWVKLSQYPQSAYDIISKYNGKMAGSYLLTVLYDGTIGFSVESPWSCIISTKAITLNTWHQITATFSAEGGSLSDRWQAGATGGDGAAKKIYIDGQLDIQNTGGGISSNTIPVLIGARYYNNTPAHLFKGSIDKAEIYSEALTSFQIQRDYERDILPVDYKMDELSGNTIFDSSQNRNDTLMRGALARTTGVCGNCLLFDGINSYADMGTGASLNGTLDFTIQALIKTSSAAKQVIIQQRDQNGYNGQYQLGVLSSGKVKWWTYGDYAYGFDIISTSVVNDDKWHYVTAVRKNGKGLLYIDGVLDSSQEAVSRNLDGAIKTVIGKDIRDNNKNFKGLIDEVRITKRALTAEDILDEYKTLDSSPPEGTININGGSTWVSSSSVTLNIAAYDNLSGVDQMQFSNDNAVWTVPEPYTVSKVYTLTSGNGQKTVYVRFKDKAGNWSGSFYDTVFLDITAPSMPIVTHEREQTADLTRIFARWSCEDKESGLESYEYLIGTTPYGGEIFGSVSISGEVSSYNKEGLNLTPGQVYYVSVRAKDRAGNLSQWGASVGVYADYESLRVDDIGLTDGGCYYTGSFPLTVAVTDPDDTSFEYQYSFSNSSPMRYELRSFIFSSGGGSSRGLNFKIKQASLGDMMGSASQSVAYKTSGGYAAVYKKVSEIFNQTPETVVQTWTRSNTCAFSLQDELPGRKTVTVQIKDSLGNQSSKEAEIFLYRRPVFPPEP